MKKRVWSGIPNVEENTIAYRLKDGLRRMGKPYYKRLVHSFVHNNILQTPGFVYYKCSSRAKDEKIISACFEKLSSLIGELNDRYGKLYSVEDYGGDYIDSKIPVSMTNQETGMHTDSSAHDYYPEIVGLCCLQPADQGGELMLCNGANYFADSIISSPEVIRILKQDFIRDLITPGMEKSPELLKLNKFPIFHMKENQFLVRYMRYWIERGTLEAGDLLSKDATQAMDHFDEYLNDPSNSLTIKMQKGDMIFFNNKFLLHGRTSYMDSKRLRRKILRAWIDL
jgi:hypothetical protein